MMFDHLLEENGLRDVFASFNLGEKDISFIKEQIAGPIESELSSQHGSKVRQRGKGVTMVTLPHPPRVGRIRAGRSQRASCMR